MRNDIVQYPKLYTGKYLPKRLSGSSDNCILNDSVTYRFNDFMTYCRQSPIIRNIVSLINRIRDENCFFTDSLKRKRESLVLYGNNKSFFINHIVL